jgi:hypothetical protein
MIPVEMSFAEWRKDPDYVKAYDALEDEFSLAAAMIEARIECAGRLMLEDEKADSAIRQIRQRPI